MNSKRSDKEVKAILGKVGVSSSLPSAKELVRRRERLGSIGALDFLISRSGGAHEREGYSLNYKPFRCSKIDLAEDLGRYGRKPKELPDELVPPTPEGLGNDYSHLLKELNPKHNVPVSVVVLTYNRNEVLRRTLIGLMNQSYPRDLIEVIVTDDGGESSTDRIIREFSEHLDIKYVWHPDRGFTPGSARNNAIRMAKNEMVIQLDVDMYPDPDLVKTYVSYAEIIQKVVLIGPRKYVDLNDVPHATIRSEPEYIRTCEEIVSGNRLATRLEEGATKDWRLKMFAATDLLKKEPLPFRAFAAGNVAFSRARFIELGGYDERFQDWGHEDGELGFRFYNSGSYFIPVMDAMAYHQEPADGINETDRESGRSRSRPLYADLCPFYRKFASHSGPYTVPTVSIYIPAFNCANTIGDAIHSALNQTFRDLEVVVCNDGSTDATADVIEKYFGNHPRVRVMHQKNGGIAAASNTAVGATRGVYVGQLDSDDYLATDVVEKCLPEFKAKPEVGLVYTSYENEYPDGRIVDGYNYPVFTREKLLTGMIVHHFRMFRKRDWCRTDGFNESLENAVDYDMYLKLSEVCEVSHLNIRGYRRRLHSDNTSIVKFKQQNRNAIVAVNDSLKRQDLPGTAHQESEDKPKRFFRVTDFSTNQRKPEILGRSASPSSVRLIDKLGGFRDELSIARGLAEKNMTAAAATRLEQALRDAYPRCKPNTLQNTILCICRMTADSEIGQGALISGLDERMTGVAETSEVSAVICSGFGWSGSSAVADFLRQYSPAPIADFARSEMKLFWRRSHGIPDLLDSTDKGRAAFIDAVWRLLGCTLLGINDGSVPCRFSEKMFKESFFNRIAHDRELDGIDIALSSLLVEAFGCAKQKLSVANAPECLNACDRFMTAVVTHQSSPQAKWCILDNAILAKDIDLLGLFRSARAVVVFRDPRDVYTDMVNQGKWKGSVRGFVEEYRSRLHSFEEAHRDERVSERVLCLHFEDFVGCPVEEQKVRSWLGMVHVGSGVNRKVYDPSRSKQNIGLFKKFGNQKEIELIARELL